MMRTIKTVAQVFLDDITNFVKLLWHPLARYLYTLVFIFTASFWLGTTIRTMFALSPAASGSVATVVICVAVGTVFWVYTIVKRARQQVKRENKEILDTIKRGKPSADWID